MKTTEQAEAIADSWFLRAIARRASQINTNAVVRGARFNSFI